MKSFILKIWLIAKTDVLLDISQKFYKLFVLFLRIFRHTCGKLLLHENDTMKNSNSVRVSY